MTLRPLRDWVLVKRLETEDMIGSLHVPDSAKTKAQRGEVLAVGSGRLTDDGVVIAPEVNKGDTVLFGKYSGSDITLDGEDYVTMKEGEILGVLEESSETSAASGSASTRKPADAPSARPSGRPR